MKIVVIVCVMVAAFSGIACALDFSADMVSSVKGGGSFTGQIFTAKDKVRMDMAGMTTITRMDKNVTWVIMPAQAMYMEQPIDMDKVVSATDKVPGEIERILLGQETIDGRATTKYKIAYISKDIRAEVFQWIDNASSIPIKTQSVDGNWAMEYRNLKTGTQDPSLFEVPAGYNKFAMPNIAQMGRMMKDAIPEE